MGRIRKTTPEEKARMQQNRDRLQRLLERRLERERAAEAEKQRQTRS
jgi:hypothetical protein